MNVRKTFLFGLVLAQYSWSVYAAPVSIENSGFEDPPLTDGAATTNSVPDWTGINLGGPFSTGVLNPNTADFSGEAPEGENVGYVRFGNLFQVTPHVVTSGDAYTLSALVGNRLMAPFGLIVQLVADGNILASTALLDTDIADDEFLLVTLDYTVAPASLGIGSSLEIWFTSDNSVSTSGYIDEVALEFVAVPLPAAGSLLFVALATMSGGISRRLKKDNHC